METLTTEQGNQIFSDILTTPLKEMGFTLNMEEGVIHRKNKNGFDEIGFDEIEHRVKSKFRLSYSAYKRIDPIEEIWEDYHAELIRFGDSYVSKTLAFDASRIKDYTFDLANLRKRMLQGDKYEAHATEEGMTEMANRFFNNIKVYVVPTFDKFNNIQVLDAFVNEKPEYYYEVVHLIARGLFYKKMIIAKLAGNKEYELVCEAMKQQIVKVAAQEGPAEEVPLRQAKYQSVYEKIYDRLKTVEPLAKPVLE